MRVWLGDFEGAEAEDLASILQEMGIRTTIKSPLVVDLDWCYYLEGNFSKLKSTYTNFKEVFEEWENYLDVMKSFLVVGMDLKDFEDNVLQELSKHRKLGSIERSEVIALIRNVLELNDISYQTGSIQEELPQDPIIRAYVEVDEETAEELGLHPEFDASVEKANNLYANVIDAAKVVDRLKDLCEERPELFELFIAADSVASILSRLEKSKNFADFMEEISVITKEGAEISFSANVVEDILNSLINEGYIKIDDGVISRLK